MRTFNYQIEKAVIASLLWNPGLIVSIRDFLKIEAFSRRYDLILQSIYDLYDKGLNVRSHAVENWLSSNLQTESYRLSEGGEGLDRSILETWGVDKDLTNFNKNVAILQKDHSISLLRDLRGKINQLIAYDDNPLYVADEIRKYLDNIENEGLNELEKIGNHAESVLIHAANTLESGGFDSTGYLDMNFYMGGYLPGMLTFLGGRSGVGKTSILMDLLTKYAECGKPCGIISLEMSPRLLATKVLSSKSGIRRRTIMDGKVGVENDGIQRGIKSMKELNIYIDAKKRNRSEVYSSIAKMAKIYGCKLIGVDYLGLIKHKTDQELNDILTDLKNEATLHDIHIIILIQLNKTEVGKTPSNRDFRYIDISDADFVLLAHRESLEATEKEKAVNPMVEIMLTKNRIFGDIGTLYRRYDKNTDSYEETNKDGKLISELKNGQPFSSNGHDQNIITNQSRTDINDPPF